MHERLHCITSSSSSTCCLRLPRFLASFSRFALLPGMLCKSVRLHATAALRTCLWTTLVHNFLDTFACQRAVVCCMLCKSARFDATAALRTCPWTNLVHNFLDTFASQRVFVHCFGNNRCIFCERLVTIECL